MGGIRSDNIRKKLLSEKDLALEKTVDICRASEKASEGMQLLKSQASNKDDVEDEEEVGQIQYNKSSRNKKAFFQQKGVREIFFVNFV